MPPTERGSPVRAVGARRRGPSHEINRVEFAALGGMVLADTPGGRDELRELVDPAPRDIVERPSRGSLLWTDCSRDARSVRRRPMAARVGSVRFAMSARERAITDEVSSQPLVRIVLADDHQVVRRGLQLLLDAQADFEVVAQAADIESARRQVLAHDPTVLVLDLNMPGGNVLDAIPELRAQAPGTQIVVLTMQQDVAFARAVLAAGALSYVLKDEADGQLVKAVRRAAAGEVYLGPRLGARIASERPPPPPDDLTERELDVLGGIALGYTSREIASQLRLSVRTVESHRRHIHEKLRLDTRAELVAYATRRALHDAK